MMKRLSVTHLLLVVLLIGACGDGSDSDNLSYTARFTGSEGESNSSGGAVVEFNSNLEVEGPTWMLDEPVPFDESLPLPDLAALGDAMGRTDWEVLDAVFTPGGTVALLDGGDGPVLMLLSDGPESAALLPPDAERLRATEELPVRVYVVIGEGSAIPATRYTPEPAGGTDGE